MQDNPLEQTVGAAAEGAQEAPRLVVMVVGVADEVDEDVELELDVEVDVEVAAHVVLPLAVLHVSPLEQTVGVAAEGPQEPPRLVVMVVGLTDEAELELEVAVVEHVVAVVARTGTDTPLAT